MSMTTTEERVLGQPGTISRKMDADGRIIQTIGTVTIVTTDASELPDLQTLAYLLGDGMGRALLAWVMYAVLARREVTLFLPDSVDELIRSRYDKEEVLIDARLSGLVGGVLITRRRDADTERERHPRPHYEVTGHT